MWNKFKEWILPFLGCIGIFSLAGILTCFFYSKAIFATDNWQYTLFFFAISGGLLAVWGRLATQKQINQSREQLEISNRQIRKSEKVSRNDRFSKAVELLKNDERGVSGRAGIYMLTSLMGEDSGEHIRCLDVIGDYLSVVTSRKHAEIAIEVLDMEMNDNPKIEYHIGSRLKWPDISNAQLYNLFLEDINLSGMDITDGNFSRSKLHKISFVDSNLKGASFTQANLHEVDFKNANLEYADLTGADMREVKNLTAEQIRSAKWAKHIYGERQTPPELPEHIRNNPILEDWLDRSIPF